MSRPEVSVTGPGPCGRRSTRPDGAPLPARQGPLHRHPAHVGHPAGRDLDAGRGDRARPRLGGERVGGGDRAAHALHCGGGPAAVQPAARRRDCGRRSRGTAWADSRAASGRSAMGILRTPIRAVGRVGLAAMFITGGADAMLAPGPWTAKAAELGVPFDPELAVRINGAAMLAAGVALPRACGPAWPRACWPARWCPPPWPATRTGSSTTRPPAASSGPISSRTSACSAAPCWCSASRARPTASHPGSASRPGSSGRSSRPRSGGVRQPARRRQAHRRPGQAPRRAVVGQAEAAPREPVVPAADHRPAQGGRGRAGRGGRGRLGGRGAADRGRHQPQNPRRQPQGGLRSPAQPGPVRPERVVRSWRERQQR